MAVLHREYRTADVDTAHRHVAEAFASHELRIGKDGSLNFVLDVSRTARLTTARMAYGADTVILGPPMGDCYHLNMPLTGESTVEHGNRRETFSAGQRGVVFGPDSPIRISWSADSRQYHLNLPRAAVEAEATKFLGRRITEDLKFDLTFDRSGDQGQSLLSSIVFLHRELARPRGIADMPSVARELESAVITQLLLTVPHQFSAEIGQDFGGSGSAAAVRAAILYLEEHLSESITLSDLVAATGIGARTLQAGFQERLGVSPLTHLRNLRLDRVHAELAEGSEGIAETAFRWGFTHLSRFSAQYRERFGELPSQTQALRRRSA